MKEAKIAKEKAEKQKKFEQNVKSVRNEFEARCAKHLGQTVENCDLNVANNPAYVCEFTKDIMRHFMDTELDNQPKVEYMKHQEHITERMRGILVDWIIEVHF